MIESFHYLLTNVNESKSTSIKKVQKYLHLEKNVLRTKVALALKGLNLVLYIHQKTATTSTGVFSGTAGIYNIAASSNSY